jgi:hypothetical protein
MLICTPSNTSRLTGPPKTKSSLPKIAHLIELFYFLAEKINPCET